MKNKLSLNDFTLINDVEASKIKGGVTQQKLCGLGYDFHTCVSYELKCSQTVSLTGDKTTCVGIFSATKV